MSTDQPEPALPPHGRAPAQTVENRMPCRWCGTQTLIATLNHYGARCAGCYEDYTSRAFERREPLPETQAVRDIRKGLRKDRPTFDDQPRARGQGGAV